MLSKVKIFFFIFCRQLIMHYLSVLREYRQRVDMLKKQLTESKAARTAKANSKPIGMDTDSSASDSSSDDEDEGTDFAVDWRAQHMK